MFETGQKKIEKRKKFKENDASNIDGFLGPWAKYVDEKEVAKPSEVSITFNTNDYLAVVSTSCTSSLAKQKIPAMLWGGQTFQVMCPNKRFQIFCIQLFPKLCGNTIPCICGKCTESG